MNIKKELEDLLKRCDKADPNELTAIHMKFMILNELKNENKSSRYLREETCCVESCECVTANLTSDYLTPPKIYTEVDLVDFGNFILSERGSKLIALKKKFINSVQNLNPNFFSVSDADICNFIDSQLND